MDKYSWPTITIDTTIEELKAIHRRIWDYVIEHGDKPCTPYIQKCVACEYKTYVVVPYCEKHALESHRGLCGDCPIQWPEGMPCVLEGSLYHRWAFGDTNEDKKELAKEIRDIDWKEDGYFE